MNPSTDPSSSPAGPAASLSALRDWNEVSRELQSFSPTAFKVLQTMVDRYAELHPCAADLARAFEAVARSFEQGGTFFVCGNGGSQSDALHIAGELDKSFKHPRALNDEQKRAFDDLPGGEELANHLQRGLPTLPLGANPALTSAIGNDNPLAHIGFAQELYALGRKGDVLLGISTSGKARNVIYAITVAKALGMDSISLTGPSDNPIAEQVDIAIRAPGASTPEVQGWHIQLYHALCEMLEAHAFGEVD